MDDWMIILGFWILGFIGMFIDSFGTKRKWSDAKRDYKEDIKENGMIFVVSAILVGSIIVFILWPIRPIHVAYKKIKNLTK
jgi:hypothetical protein